MSVDDIKVLLVDDVEMNLKVLFAMLKKLKLKLMVETASSGDEALNKMSTSKPDMVLTDMWMPKMNGEELTNAIRMNSAYQGVLVFAVTADIEVKSNFNMEKFDGILFKPVSIDKLKLALFPNP